KRAEDRIGLESALANKYHGPLMAARIEAGVEHRDGPDSSFASRRRRSSDEPAQSLEHPPLPQGRVASQVAAVPDQPVGIADVLEAQQVRLRHCRHSPV